MQLSLATVTFQLAIGLGVAVLLNAGSRFLEAVRTAFILPMVLPRLLSRSSLPVHSFIADAAMALWAIVAECTGRPIAANARCTGLTPGVKITFQTDGAGGVADDPRRANRCRQDRRRGALNSERAVVHGAAALLLAIVLFPALWMLQLSFLTGGDIFDLGLAGEKPGPQGSVILEGRGKDGSASLPRLYHCRSAFPRPMHCRAAVSGHAARSRCGYSRSGWRRRSPSQSRSSSHIAFSG